MPRYPRFVAILTAVATLIMLAAVSGHGFAGDLLMDIANGRWILAHGVIPLHNVATQAMYGKPWSDSEWLYGVYTAWLYGRFGRMGVFWGLVPFLAAIALFVGSFAARAGRTWGFLLAVLAASSLTIAMDPRPQLISYGLFAFGMWAVLEYRSGRRWPVWAFATTVVLWTNVHASALLAPALLLGELVLGPRERRSGLVLPTLLAIVLLPLHPGGLNASGGFLAQIFSPGVLGLLQEWMSPNFQTYTGAVILPWLVLSLSFLVTATYRAKDWAGLAWVLVGPLMALFAVRFAPYMVLGSLALAGVYWPERLRNMDVPRLATATAAAFALLLVALTAADASAGSLFPQYEPVAAIAYLRAHDAHDVLPFYTYGDALELYGVRPFLDGKAELWTRRSWWPAYVAALKEQDGIAQFAARWDPQARWILWPLNGYDNSQPLKAPGWRLVFVDRQDGSRIQVGVWRRSASGIPTRGGRPLTLPRS